MPACVLHIKLIPCYFVHTINSNVNINLFFSIKDVIRVDLNERFQTSHILNMQVYLYLLLTWRLLFIDI